IPSVGHIGRREGIDDYKYVYTLQQLIDKATARKEPKARNAARESKRFLEALFAKVSINPYESDASRQERKRLGGDVMLGDWRPDSHITLDDYNRFRKGIAEQIISLQKTIGG
ncbi:MAG: hypothetical protein QF792_01350, partial [Phycisphaerae bacterium]|nr:hypothetical protein [Phycisphaerae bacterium]